MGTAPLRSRVEVRLAVAASAAGGLVAAVIMARSILTSASSTAAIGFIFLPLWASAVAVPCGIWGLALGHLWARARGERQGAAALLALAVLIAVAAPAGLGWKVRQGLQLRGAVHEALAMDARQLEAVFDRSPWNRNRFFLGALAQNRLASPELLDSIATLPDPELQEAMGSLWDVMGSNRKGIAVLRLIAAHPNTRPSTLEKIAAAARNDYLIGDVLRNPATPAHVLERYHDSSDYLIEWGLARNPNLPAAIFERLSRSPDRYTRLGLTQNPATPGAILERLAEDPDPLVAEYARLVIERRRAQDP